MQFTYHINSGEQNLKIDGDLHKYLFKIRREKASKELFFRNLVDNNIYRYKVVSINKKETLLSLIDFEETIITSSKYLHIGWCLIDTKNIEKIIASLNEIGVSKITFIKCSYSQSKYKINYDKLQRLLQNSSSQCGRSDIIKLDSCDSLDKFLQLYPQSYMFNFSSNHIKNFSDDIETIVIGCEGGFSEDEVAKFDKNKIVGCGCNTILKSETAVLTASSVVLV